MPTFQCYGQVVGSKYLGEVEAATKEEAEEKALELDNCSVTFCHNCESECEDAEVKDVVVERDFGDDEQYLARIGKMTQVQLLAELMDHPEYLVDGYYRKFSEALRKRYAALSKKGGGK